MEDIENGRNLGRTRYSYTNAIKGELNKLSQISPSFSQLKTMQEQLNALEFVAKGLDEALRGGKQSETGGRDKVLKER